MGGAIIHAQSILAALFLAAREGGHIRIDYSENNKETRRTVNNESYRIHAINQA